MDFSPELLAAAARELEALLSSGNELVEQNENEFDQELLQNVVEELELELFSKPRHSRHCSPRPRKRRKTSQQRKARGRMDWFPGL